MVTLGTEESGHCKEVSVVERFLTRINVWPFLSTRTKKSGRCREVAISRGSTVCLTLNMYYAC